MTAAPDLSPAEAAIVDRFDAAPDLPESWAGQQRMAAGYAQARDRLADQERRQALTGLRDEVVAGVERALLREAVATVVQRHWLVAGSPEGLICRCGWVGQGATFDDHRGLATADAVLALPELRAALRDQP